MWVLIMHKSNVTPTSPSLPGHGSAKETYLTNTLPHGVGVLTVFDNIHMVYIVISFLVFVDK